MSTGLQVKPIAHNAVAVTDALFAALAESKE
jgi:hypothetical protein